jgi:hypothetical protein
MHNLSPFYSLSLPLPCLSFYFPPLQHTDAVIPLQVYAQVKAVRTRMFTLSFLFSTCARFRHVPSTNGTVFVLFFCSTKFRRKGGKKEN